MLWVITLALAAGTCVEVPLPLIDEALISGSRILISDKLEKLCLEYDGGMLNVFKHLKFFWTKYLLKTFKFLSYSQHPKSF